jgi:nucleoside-diphosphate-sugar epimerase
MVHSTKRSKVSMRSFTLPPHFTTILLTPTVCLIVFGCLSVVDGQTYSDLIVPAVHGTTSILNSALKHGNNLKRLILTSSAVAILEVTTVPRVFTESSWNEAAVEAVKTKGSAAGPFMIYSASKTLAEKAAWEFVATHNSEISWDLAVVNPSLILGVRLSHPLSLLLT